MTTTYEDVFGMPTERPEQAEDGAYRARLAAEPFTAKNPKQPEPNEFRVWTFKVEDAEIVVTGSTSMFIGPESKAFAWATALLGHEPAKGTTLADLVGCPATIVVARNQKGYAKVVSVKEWPEGRTDAQTIADEPLAF